MAERKNRLPTVNTVNYLLLLSLFLASCSPPAQQTQAVETKEPDTLPQSSPVIICSAPQGLYPEPNAIIMFTFKRNPADPDVVSWEFQPYAGSDFFKPNPDGSLNGGVIPGRDGKDITLVQTGVPVLLPFTRLKNGTMLEINLGGCLVDQKEQQLFQRFFSPGYRFDGEQAGLIPGPRQKNNPMSGDIHYRRISHASKPIRPAPRTLPYRT